MRDAKMQMDVSFLNSKGFGGNNATASVLSPTLTEAMLSKRYGDKAMQEYRNKRETVRATAAEYDKAATAGDLRVIYRFGEGIIEDHEIGIDQKGLKMSSFSNPVNLAMSNPFDDMTG